MVETFNAVGVFASIGRDARKDLARVFDRYIDTDADGRPRVPVDRIPAISLQIDKALMRHARGTMKESALREALATFADRPGLRAAMFPLLMSLVFPETRVGRRQAVTVDAVGSC